MAEEIKKIKEEELENVSGGQDGIHGMYLGPEKRVQVETGYLALRTEAAYDASNEIGKLYSGYTVWITGNTGHAYNDFNGPGVTEYVWVYSKELNKSGYVNSRFLV